LLNPLEQSARIDQRVIVGRTDLALIEELTGRKARHILRKTSCSLLIAGEPETS
jgi:hypothetical protein